MQNQIQINQLLMEREDHLVDIFEFERQVGIILGGAAYPFLPPMDLPSTQKRKKKTRKKNKIAPQATPPKLRKLDPEKESAYRITYLDQAEEKTEIHTDPRPLNLLLSTPLPDLQILQIETVQSSDNEWASVEMLFEPAPPS